MSAPSSASAKAMPRPTPRPAPVTSATRPANDMTEAPARFLLTFELRVPLFEKRGYTFAKIDGSTGFVLQPCLEIELLLVRVRPRCPVRTSDQGKRARSVRELARDAHCAFHERRVVLVESVHE